MKNTHFYLLIFIILTFYSCKAKKEDFILNSVGKEWELAELNGRSKMIDFNRLYIVFKKDSTYEIYYKDKGKRVDTFSDNIIKQNWYFDNNENLYISSFSSSKFKLLSLDKKNLVFQFGKEEYHFFCNECN